jgi:hypothetical protein
MPDACPEAAVELVVAATEQHYIAAGQTDAMGNNPCTCGEWWDAAGDNPGWDQHMAEVALKALADAGLLLPGGAEQRTEWGLRLTRPDGSVSDFPCADRADAEDRATTHREMRVLRTHWPPGDPSVVQRRAIAWASPWSSVSVEPKGVVGG